ncbi:DUF4190 domain-containing protein [Rhodanobacter sp. DHB23]|uniref:DUF4190 domain-containing protein n=1 Tax=Rhodanobacter sp. DHB23 TaxID=2775923 RepID=UPI001782EDA0|nr:DUF4190 domain-containing protein [Rhodanobacter sp. DHB23]MBD8871942.1 DUF4190 domain-containing protein [Rhodanobacter sp. DHB23]
MSYQPPQRSTTSSMAIVSLVFGILTWFMLPFIGALIAVICGHLARGEIRRAPIDQRIEGDGMAVAGLVLGYVQLAFSVLVVVFVIAMLVFGFGFAHWH